MYKKKITEFATREYETPEIYIDQWQMFWWSKCLGAIWNKCEQSNTSGNILNAGENADDEEIFGFSESYFKIAPRHLDECTKRKLLNLQQENMRLQRYI